MDAINKARLQPYLGRPAIDLSLRLEEWWTDFRAGSVELEFVDKPLARKLYQAARQAVQRPTEQRDLLQAAILYLCECDDEEHDHLPRGMEDDAEVWNSVCEALGWADLRV